MQDDDHNTNVQKLYYGNNVISSHDTQKANDEHKHFEVKKTTQK